MGSRMDNWESKLLNDEQVFHVVVYPKQTKVENKPRLGPRMNLGCLHLKSIKRESHTWRTKRPREPRLSCTQSSNAEGHIVIPG